MVENKLDYEKFKSENYSERKSSRVANKKTGLRKRFSLKPRIPTNSFLYDLTHNKSLLSKIFVTILVVLVYRLLASIPLPGMDMAVYNKFFGQTSSASEANYFFSIFTGGFLDTPSVIGLGIASYINASIIMQLLTPVIPKLSELSKDGARGQQIVNQYTRYLTLPLSLIYSSIYLVFLSQRDINDTAGTGITASPEFLIPRVPGTDWPSITKIIFMAIVLTAGTMFLMWLAEVISEAGIGNGSSIIIASGILASIPTLIRTDLASLQLKNRVTEALEGNLSTFTDPVFLSIIGVLLGIVVVTGLVVFTNESIRRIKIQYARRSSAATPAQESHLPIKLTLTGVLPIIFASAFLSLPQLVVPLIINRIDDTNSATYKFLDSIQTSFLFSQTDNIVNTQDFQYAFVYFLFIVAFGMFYAYIAMKPKETAESLQKQSAFIPGIRPGNSTEKYISGVLGRISFAGAIFLAFLALFPLVARNLIVSSTGVNLAVLSGIGGTSILIVVGVFLDTMRQYNSLKVAKSYEKYI